MSKLRLQAVLDVCIGVHACAREYEGNFISTESREQIGKVGSVLICCTDAHRVTEF